jgi:replicative DNA helicase
MTVEKIILSNLIYKEDFSRKVIPFLKPDYFAEITERIIYTLIDEYVKKYNSCPSQQALSIELDNSTGINESVFKDTKDLIHSLKEEKTDISWLLDTSEKWCQKRATHLALEKIIEIHHTEGNNSPKGEMLQILMDAEAVCFDDSIGHEFLEDSEGRLELYSQISSGKCDIKVPFHLQYFNEITRGGVSQKTFNMFMGGPGIGKTLVLCDCAAAQLAMGYNVLYITLEMSEESIAERIDANLLDIPINSLIFFEPDGYRGLIKKLKKKTNGRLFIKEYPTTSAGASHFRYLLRELKIKKNFKPAIIYIDYVNICASSRMTLKNGNSYLYIKSICEELRGLAVEEKVPIISATQINREGFKSSEIGMENTAECIFVDETVELTNGEIIKIKDVKIGDVIKSHDKERNVINIFPIKKKECVKITLKSGKTVIVSKDHIFPSSLGRMSVNTGLSISSKINSK